MLWVRQHHEPLEAARWDEERVCRAISDIVRDTEERFDPVRLWPVHPLDDVGPSPAGIYLGAAGVMWALHHLARRAAVAPRLDFSKHIAAVHAAYLAAPDTGAVVPSLFLGEAGILLVAQRLAPSAPAADRLHQLVLANVSNPANELLWGASGTLLAALFMLEWTGEARWRSAVTSSTERLLSEWHSSRNGAFLWTQHLYGEVVEYLGADTDSPATPTRSCAPRLCSPRHGEPTCTSAAPRRRRRPRRSRARWRIGHPSRASRDGPTGLSSGATERPAWSSGWPRCRWDSTGAWTHCSRREAS